MRTTRRTLVLVAITSVFVAAFTVPALAGPAGDFVAKINASRSAAGLSPVESYWDLSDDARRHSDLMAERGEIFHSSNLGSVTTGWERLGENVGVGLDVGSLHDAFMNSSSHRANILGDYNYVGVGVTIDGDGFMWVTAVFMKAAPGLNGGGTTTTSSPPTTTTTTSPPVAIPVSNAPQPSTPAPGGTGIQSPTSSGTSSDTREDPLADISTKFGNPTPPAVLI